MSDLRLIIAFSEPPATWGFHRAKSGKCWVRTIDGLEWALQLSRSLADAGIQGVIKKIEPPASKPKRPGMKPAAQCLTTGEPLGKLVSNQENA